MKNKKLIFNIAMVAVIIAIVVCGFVFVNNIKNGKSSDGINQDEIFGTVTTTKGNVRIERNGIGYTLKPDTIIIKGDKLSTLGKSTAELSLNEDSTVVLDENTKLTATPTEDGENKEYQLHSGNIFVNAKANDPIAISYKSGKLTPSDAVFSINVHEGVPGVNVYYGTVNLTSDKNEKIGIEAGSCAFTGSNGAVEASDFSASSMSEFNIKQAQKILDKPLCFSTTEMEGVLSKRAEIVEKAFREKELRLQELQALGSAEVIVGIDDVKPEASSEKAQKAPQASKEPDKKENSSETQINNGTDLKIILDADNEMNSNSDFDNTSINVPKDAKTMTATIAISCRTLLDNMDKLLPGKDIYVPDDGSILDAITVEFKEGETVLDILKRVCNANGIQLECSWFPIYNSYYIEGINHIYEFDGGDGSGWIYEVNGWKPNYGVSAYKVADGDYISFDYTCDMGYDLGNPVS